MARNNVSELLNSSDAAALQLIVNKKLQSRIKGVLNEYGLNLTQWLIISRLSEREQGMRTTDLAHFMHVEVPLVTMMSRPLLVRGLITSDINKPDKRERLLRPTNKAKDIAGAVQQKLSEQLSTMAKDIPTPDLQAYFRVLRTMVGSAA